MFCRGDVAVGFGLAYHPEVAIRSTDQDAVTERELLIEETDDTEQEIALKLAARCGLRRNEVVRITPADIVTSERGNYHVRVWQDVAKHDHYREPPVPDGLATQINTLVDVTGIEDDEPVVDVADKTVYRWVKRACRGLRHESGDVGWNNVDVHDLRRSWATHVLGEGVLPSVVMSWGGWHDWDTFRRHYLGEFSPEVLDRERQKVDFLADGDPVEADTAANNVMPSSSGSYADD